MIKGPSKHLSWKELACKDGTSYPEEWRNNRAIQLSNVYELVREECGNKPIYVVSAFRTIEWNKKIGGAVNSQHIQGRALDLKHSNLTIEEFYLKVKRMTDLPIGIGGLGLYTTFIHVDIRPTTKAKRVFYWIGSGVKDDYKSI